MTARRKWTFVLTSVALWALLGFTLWGLLGTLETGCKLQEERSGLWAECFAPAGLIYTTLFATIFLIDLVRTASVLWPTKPSKE
jgi:hypothetical protein